MTRNFPRYCQRHVDIASFDTIKVYSLADASRFGLLL